MTRATLFRFFLTALVVLVCTIPGATGSAAAEPARAKEHMVAAANPLAAEAGHIILRQGGSALDAAVAMQMVLTLVEPQSSGIGGGAFLLHYDAKTGRTVAYDGRETAPAAIDPKVFLGADGKPLRFFEAVVGGRSVGVPGVLAMLRRAYDVHGRAPWQSLFAPAIRLAADGFPVSPRLNKLLATEKFLKQDPAAGAYFYDADGAPWPVDHLLRNPALASTLRALAQEGPQPFYDGRIAVDVVRAVRTRDGSMALADLRGYKAMPRAALCRPYRVWRVCTMPPPTSGGVTTLQILGLLERFDVKSMAPGSATAVHLISEASRLAYADRARYLADPDFVAVPVAGLLDPAYLRARSHAIKLDWSMGKAAAGEPPRQKGAAPGDGVSIELPSTSHFSVVDADGNAVSMTTSIENVFGARIMVRGFLLNNQLTDFSFRPENNGRPVANRVEGGKRPRSSMSPTLVFDKNDKLVLAVGSPGGSRIIAYVVQTLIAALDWGLDMQAAIDLPRHANRNGATELEENTALADIADALRSNGHEVRLKKLTSGLHGIRVTPAGLEGGADPRREGVALGN